MGFFRFTMLIVLFLLFIYYFMLVLQLWDVITFTNKKITFKGLFIPFYYWIY